VFDSIGNMPLHPLVVHAVVIGAPLCVLLALLFAFPRTRTWARWPLALAAIGTLGAALVARASGPSLAATLKLVPVTADNPVSVLIARHAMLASQLVLILVGFTVLALLNSFLVTRPARMAAGGEPRALDRILPILLIIAGVLVMIWCFRVGDAGSRAVWNPTGATQY
jgi:hypothetical protein